jgi:UDP-N-acetylglucosamine 4-epimerase
MPGKKILLTGGAGFIGSNILRSLIADARVEMVRVLDNLSTGSRANFAEFEDHPKFEFIWGDIRDYSACLDAARGMDMICHQAALGSVPRSIKYPLTTNEVNITGTLNVFTAAKDAGINRLVFAASSSTYGDSEELPKKENIIGAPISPYAVTKLVNELYAKVFNDLYSIDYIGLRYFNVFGPWQDPSGAYAAVIPLFIKALINNTVPIIHGDGSQSRDFTFVDNAVEANTLALFTEDKSSLNQIYNIACGQQTSVKELFEKLKIIAGSDLNANFSPSRLGDVKHSVADISKAQRMLGYVPPIKVEQGLQKAFDWFKEHGFN